jgi:hypothetical protein
LLQELVAKWGGNIDDPEKKSRDCWNSYDTNILGSLYIYPIYTGTLKDIRFMVEISRFVGSVRQMSMIVSVEGILYLRIYFFTKNNFNLTFSHEEVGDRMQKKLHLTTEVQSGDPEFDKRFFIQSSTENGATLLHNSRVREWITHLYPFDRLEIIPSGIVWSRNLSDKTQLAFPFVEKIVETIFKLAETVNELNIEVIKNKEKNG